MRVLRANGYRHMPWKNGGGETAEIAIAPEHSGVDAFDWRVSMARVDSDGPFSSFPGVDRTLTIIEGAGLRLSIDGNPIDVTRHLEPFSFRGEARTHATRIGGAVTDLNVMTRRERFSHRVTRVEARGELVMAADASVAMLFCGGGSLLVESAQHAERLHSADSLLMHTPLTLLRLKSDPATLALWIEICPRAIKEDHGVSA
jgi:uncharacterized protein